MLGGGGGGFVFQNEPVQDTFSTQQKPSGIYVHHPGQDKSTCPSFANDPDILSCRVGVSFLRERLFGFVSKGDSKNQFGETPYSKGFGLGPSGVLRAELVTGCALLSTQPGFSWSSWVCLGNVPFEVGSEGKHFCGGGRGDKHSLLEVM